MALIGIVPMLEVNDLEETIKFYTEILDFEYEGYQCDYWANLKKDSINIMFTPRYSRKQHKKPLLTGSIYIYTTNVDEIWESIQNKVKIEYPLENFDYGMREFAIRDCNGYMIQFGQAIE